MVRCFVGVFIPEEVKSYILLLQDELGKLDLDCKMVEPENIHVSLSFLGDVDDKKLEIYKNILLSIADKYRKFSIVAGGIKLIPTEKFVRVIVVDVSNEMLDRLQSDIVEKIGGDAKPPHITLCRIRSPLKLSQLERIKAVQTKEISFTVDSVELIQSIVTRQGPMYTSIIKSPLL